MIAKLFMVLCVALSAKAVAVDSNSYMGFTDKVADEIIALIKQENLTRPETEDRFGQILDKYFDMKAIGEYVLGRYRSMATPEQKQEFQKLFRILMIKNYTSSFSNYKNEQVKAQSVREAEEGVYVVKSAVKKEDNPNPLFVEWLIYPGPIIYDVIVEGVSQAQTQRSEYSSIIQRNGGTIDALLSEMRQQVERYNK